MDQSTKTGQIAAEQARVPATQLAVFVARAFVAAGLPDADAQAVAALMVEADLRGSDTHGVIRLPLYVRRLRTGGIKARPNIRTVSDCASVALIDGCTHSKRSHRYLGNGPNGLCHKPEQHQTICSSTAHHR